MRIVVLYALAGGGHLSAAKALKAQLDGPDCEVIPVDSTRSGGSSIFSAAICTGFPRNTFPAPLACATA